MTAPLTLRLPLPPSVNAAYANVPGRGRVKTAAYKAWHREASWAVKMQLPPIPRGTYFGMRPVSVSYEMQRVDNRRRDLGNLEKLASDLLTTMRVWVDDSQVHELHMRWADVEGCVVTISELEA